MDTARVETTYLQYLTPRPINDQTRWDKLAGTYAPSKLFLR
jgi:hypothetical protein